MFEFSIARKYLLPRWRQLSVSIISLISVIVISLVVWLILVFFSVTTGLEKIWVQKLIALTAPIRVTPQDAYYRSYYYQIDNLSADSDYTLKSIGEKQQAPKTDPYSPDFDEAIPATFAKKDLAEDGSLKDLVKIAYAAINSLEDVTAQDYEMTYANLRLRLIRGLDQASDAHESFLTQSAYLGSFDGNNPDLPATLLPLTPEDLKNSYAMLTISAENIQEDNPEQISRIEKDLARQRISEFLKHLNFPEEKVMFSGKIPSAAFLKKPQGIYSLQDSKPYWIYQVQEQNGKIDYALPSDPLIGEGILLPKSFKEGGVLVGDRGYISYFTPTTSSLQEQRLSVFVAGFYDPGIVPIGGKYILANHELTNFIRTAHNQEDTTLSNGINVRFKDLNRAEEIKKELTQAFEKAGIAPYWKIETFREFDFAKDLLQQLKSEKNIFSLIAAVIIIVACSNIISMLIILVNDKRVEIGILRSLGATSFSIAAIFGFCGMIMGFVGSLIGTILAYFTLKEIQTLLNLISRAQGFQAFNPMFYGNTLPSEMSAEALSLVLVATVIASLLAGLVPAIKASRLKPAHILRADG